MLKISGLISTGNLGDNMIEVESFREGLTRQIDFFAADAGTADVGPVFLGSDTAHNPAEWEYHDLELLLLAARDRGVPLIVGSCGTTGTDRGVDLYASMIRDIAQRHRLAEFRLVRIYSQVSHEVVASRTRRGLTEPLSAPSALTEELLERTDNITASMGVEQFCHALDLGADVVLAGRACDDAVIAAVPVFYGMNRGAALHMGKAAECASLVCSPQMVKESIVATIQDEHFTIEPLHPNQSATPHSVAAHSMYERVDPYTQAVPGGVLDMHASRFEALTPRICRVSGSKFRPSFDGSYKVKLEGAGYLGERAYQIVGVRDPNAIQNLGTILKETRKKVSAIVGLSRESEYELFFHTFGLDAILKENEPIRTTLSHEVAVIIEVVSRDSALV
jgi:cysteine synthase